MKNETSKKSSKLLAMFLLVASIVTFLPACNDKKQCELYALQFPYITRIGQRTDQDCVNMNILLFFVLNWDVLYGQKTTTSSSTGKQAELESIAKEALDSQKVETGVLSN